MMSPRSVYGVTSLHREWGGLRRLDFFIAHLEVGRGQRERSSVSVLILGWDQGNIALPLATLGYRITVLEADATVVDRARRSIRELKLEIECLEGSVSVLGHRMFDRIIFDTRRGGVLDSWASLSTHLPPDGTLLLTVPKQPGTRNWQEARAAFKREGWRVRDAAGLSFFSLRRKVFVGASGRSRGKKQFRLLDVVDGWVADRLWLRGVSGWLVELETCDPTAPYVIHLLPTFGVGGTERLVYELTARLPTQGFQSKAVAMIEGGPLESAFEEREVPFQVVTRRDPFGLSTLRDLSRLFFLQRPDIVHTHLFGADAWGRLAAFWQRVPIVLSTEHNVNPSYGFIKRVVNWLFAKKTSALIAVSETVKEVMLQKDRLEPAKVHTIVNGIDLKSVVPRGGRPFQDIPRLIIVGRLYPQKDHETLFRALALVTTPWRLKIVGAGPLERSLRSLSERLGIASRLEWLGVRSDVPQLLAESDLFCFPSRWEGLGLAALEAAAAGVPIIASDLLPLREILQPEDVCYVSAGDVSAWAASLRTILDNPTPSVMRANRAVPRLQASASIDTMVAAYAKLYHRLLSGTHPPL